MTEMLSFSKPSSVAFKLLSFSSVGGGVSCDEFVTEIFVGDNFGLVVLCGLLQSVFWFNCINGDAPIVLNE